MTDKSSENRELVSALVDGQLRGDEFAQVMAHLESSNDARQTWYAYHVVGDVMRTGQTAVSAHDADFVLRLRTRLQEEAEPLVLQHAGDLMADDARASRAQGKPISPTVSANDNSWRLVVGLASVSMVGVMAWQGLQGLSSERSQLATAPITNLSAASQMTQSSAPVSLATGRATAPLSASTGRSELTMGTAPIMIRDTQLDALLAAHRQFGGTSALQMPTGFLRNATFEEGVR